MNRPDPVLDFLLGVLIVAFVVTFLLFGVLLLGCGILEIVRSFT